MAWNRSLSPGESAPFTKLTLRFCSLLLTVVALVLSGLSLSYAWSLLIPLAFTFVWNLANIIRRLTSQTPVVPAANVSIDLIIWLVFIVTLLFTWAGAIESVSYPSYGYYGYYSYRYFRTGAKMALGAAALATVVFVLTFVLWVWACVDCHRYRYSERYPLYMRGVKDGHHGPVAPPNLQNPAAVSVPTGHTEGYGKQETAQPLYA